MFLNRQHAGRLLAKRLKDTLSESGRFRPADTVVIGLPRGGVPVAAEIATELKCHIDILVSKKIRAPDNPELAIGAVSSAGVIVLDDRYGRFCVNTSAYEEAQRAQKERLVDETRELEERWLKEAGMTERPDWRGKLVILADDGVATGMTTLAAIRSVRGKGAKEIVLATPVTPYDTHLMLKQECDDLVALSIPYEFTAVGYYYRDFHQVPDEEVVAALKAALAVQV